MTLADPAATATATATATAVDHIYRRAAAGATCWARNHRGHLRELPMGRWIGGPATTAADKAADEYVLQRCSGGVTLDLGCGPGRFAAMLHHRGRFALGVDSSSVAVELTRRRGGVAILGDVFSPLPAEGCWDQVLLIDGNIGIGGDPVRILLRAGELLAADGAVIVEIDATTTVASHELQRWETDGHVGRWFVWSQVGAAGLSDVAAASGFAVATVADVHGRMIAVLRKRPT